MVWAAALCSGGDRRWLCRCSGYSGRRGRGAADYGESESVDDVADCFQKSRRGAAGGGAASASFGCSFPCESEPTEGIRGCARSWEGQRDRIEEEGHRRFVGFDGLL
jgi:hypothetical protein